MMTKYKVGDEFQHSRKGVDSVYMKIIFVPPLDGKGVQHYLCTVLSGYWDGAEKMFLSLTTDESIDEHFMIRKQPFEWIK
ncbi:hypothetical protein COE51_01420 [Bacillus pseudomycoides]|nr:hypothetical protein COE51_01420 [Bacillus pseudomycoides]